MSLFGEKCERCGDRTKDTFRDLPTCPACRQDIETGLQINDEEVRTCPVDGTPMDKQVAHVVVIDRCPKCNGIWLDGGEYERLSSDTVSRSLVAATRGAGLRR